MIVLPTAPTSKNERVLMQWTRERVTGITGSTLTFSNVITSDVHLLFKNGSLLDPETAYTVTYNTVALTVAAISGDVFVLFYHFPRTTT